MKLMNYLKKRKKYKQIKNFISKRSYNNSSWRKALKSRKTAKTTFSEFGIGSELPEISLKSDQLKAGLKIVDFLSMNKITTSKSEARRIINNKGLKIENILVTDDKKFF